MNFDPFDLIPTHTSPIVSVEVPTQYKSIVPQLPPQTYSNVPDQKFNSDQMFEALLSTAKSDNAPLYEYSFEQERRYSNPYLQFNPQPLGGSDIEDIYGEFQGSGQQLWNALVKTGATAGASFVSSFSSFGSSIDSLRGGKPFDEDSILGQTQGWLKELEDKYPNYYTEWEREHPFLSAVSPSGMANFWGDKVLKNVGFTVGSLASSILVDAGIELATAGTATPGTFILAANQINKAIEPIKNAFRNLSKASVLNKVDDVAGMSRVGQGINQGLSAANQTFNLRKGLQFAGTTYFAAQGEAMIEGYQTYWDTKSKLYEQNIDSLTVDKIAQIEELAQEAANTTTALNLPIIMASNLLQFPIIFGNKNLLKQFDSPFLDIVNKQGLTAVNNYSRKQAWVNTLKEFTKDFVTEGGEEGYQYYVGNSVHDYYVDKFNSEGQKSLGQFLINQLPKTIEDEKFWESFVIGGLAGGLMGTYGSVKSNFVNEKTQKAVETLQPILDRFNSTVKDYVHLNETIEHADDPVNSFHTAHKALYSTVHDALKYGVYQNFIDATEDLKSLSVEEYNKLFNTEFNESQKLSHIASVQLEAEQIKNDVAQVNKFFQVNPFDSPYVNQRLKDIMKVDQTQIENIKRKLFEDYKELNAYNISRLRNTRSDISTVEEELKMMGIDESIIPVLYNLDSEKGLKEYLRFKKIQLETLEKEKEYYQELGQPVPDLKLRINGLNKVIDQLSKPLGSDQVREILFREEIGTRQLRQEEFFQKQEQLKKQQDIALNIAADLDQQVTKPETKVKEIVETVSKIVPPEVKNVPEPKSKNIFNKNFGSLNEGDIFEIQLSTEGGQFKVITKVPFIAEKEGIRYQFLPDRVIKYDNGEQVLRYALDNIGVQKIDKVEQADQQVPVVQEISEVPDVISQVTPQVKPKKETITKQQKLKEAVDKNKSKSEVPVKDGIYLIDGDYKNAWRYVDENTAVPLSLTLKANKLWYKGDQTKGINKRIDQGYLLDDQFIDTSVEQVQDFGYDISSIFEQELEPSSTGQSEFGISLDQLKLELTKNDQPDNLNKFLNEPISELLNDILKWRLGKGIRIDC